MVAKYRVSLTELDIAALAGYCMDAKDYKRYVLLNTQLEKINGGIRQPDYAAAGVRQIDASTVQQVANNSFTIQNDSKYIPGTTIQSNATIREKFTLMGHTKLTWAEMDLVCMELGMDTSIPDRDKKFFEHLQCHTMYVCNTTDKSNEQCDVFDMAIDMIADDDFIGNYKEQVLKYNIRVQPVVGMQVGIDTKSQDTGSFMDYIPPVDEYSQQRTEVVQPNTVVDVLNKFGL